MSRPIQPHEAEQLLRRELRIMGLTPGTPEHDGALAAGRAGLSTSARLRQVQADLAAAVTQLRELAAANRRDACNLSQPYCWGPNRAAGAFEQAAVMVEQALGGES